MQNPMFGNNMQIGNDKNINQMNLMNNNFGVNNMMLNTPLNINNQMGMNMNNFIPNNNQMNNMNFPMNNINNDVNNNMDANLMNTMMRNQMMMNNNACMMDMAQISQNQIINNDMNMNNISNNSQNANYNQNDINVINIIFRNTELKTNNAIKIKCNQNEKVSEIIRKYRERTGDREPKEKFIFNAKELNDQLTVGQSQLYDGSIIFVVLLKGVKGA